MNEEITISKEWLNSLIRRAENLDEMMKKNQGIEKEYLLHFFGFISSAEAFTNSPSTSDKEEK